MNLSKKLTAEEAKQIVRTTIQTDIEIKSDVVLDQIFNAIKIYAKKEKVFYCTIFLERQQV